MLPNEIWATIEDPRALKIFQTYLDADNGVLLAIITADKKRKENELEIAILPTKNAYQKIGRTIVKDMNDMLKDIY